MNETEPLPADEVEILREVHKGGEAECLNCGEDINFLRSHPYDDLRGGVKFDCPYCDDDLINLDGKQIEDFIRIAGWRVRSENVQEVIDLLDNVMTDEDLNRAIDKLTEIKLGIKASERGEGFNIDEPQKTNGASE